MLDEYRGIPWQAQLLLYLTIVPSVVIGFLYTDISYYLKYVQQIPSFWEGTIIATFGVAIVASSVPLGIIADRYGRRKMLILGNISSGACLLGFALTSNVALLVLLAIAEGVGEAAFAVSFSALIADRAGDAKRTAAFSLGYFLNWIGMAIGALSIYSAVAVSRADLFLFMGVANIAVTPIALGVGETPRSPEPRRSMLPRKSRRVLARYGVYAALIGTGSGFFVPLMTQWFQGRYGTPDTVSAGVLVVSYFATAGVILLAPRLARRFGTVKGMIVTQAPATVLMPFIPSSPTFPIAGGLYVVRAFLMNNANPLGQSLLMGQVSSDERGAASGLIAISNRLPNAITAIPGAVLIGEGLYASPFYVGGVLYALAVFWLWAMFRNTRLPEEEDLAKKGSTRPNWKDSLRPVESLTP